MELRFAVKAVLFGWILCDSLSLAIRMLRYDAAITPAISFTTAELDGEQFVSYDSNITEVIPKTEWIKKISAVRPDYWESEKERMWRELEDLQHLLNLAVELFNHTKGVHTLQWVYGCELDDDGTIRGYDQYGYDGEDFISLNLKTGTWTAAKLQAEIMTKWDPDGRYARDRKNYLEKECIEWLKQYMSYRREALERKVRLEASLFQNHSSSPEVVCHATGFFPKALNISWQKDGEDVHEDVELRETLPNQDGSFQKRSILRVPAEELQKHTYTCVIQHSSLEKELVLPVSERRILRGGGSGGGSGGAPIGVIVGVVAALVALVAVVAGIVVWKKRNTGFKPVPAKPSSEGDSSSNTSSSVTVCLPAELREREEEMEMRNTDWR